MHGARAFFQHSESLVVASGCFPHDLNWPFHSTMRHICGVLSPARVYNDHKDAFCPSRQIRGPIDHKALRRCSWKEKRPADQVDQRGLVRLSLVNKSCAPQAHAIGQRNVTFGVIAESLRRNGLNGGQRILDAMLKLVDEQLLSALRAATLGDVDQHVHGADQLADSS